MATKKETNDKIVKKPTEPETKKTAATKTEDKKPSLKPAETVKKSTAKKYHIAQRNDNGMWQVKAEGAEKALKLFKTQQEAIDYAKKVADSQDGSIMIHKKDGSFRKLTY